MASCCASAQDASTYFPFPVPIRPRSHSCSSHSGGFAGILVPLFGYVASLGFVFPNSAALAMGPQGERAGSAAALLGTVQFSAATLASIAVGFFHDGTARPMSAVIAVCGALALLAQRLLVRQ